MIEYMLRDQVNWDYTNRLNDSVFWTKVKLDRSFSTELFDRYIFQINGEIYTDYSNRFEKALAWEILQTGGICINKL